jgi:dTDP-4-dehydrorhamnose reductase
MKILVTGANGLLGQHLIKLLLENDYQVLASGIGPSRLPFLDGDLFTYSDTDITDAYAVDQLINTGKPELIIHAAAMTQVDQCEQNRDLCMQVNVMGTANLLRHAQNYCSFFIYISTDFIFDGEKGGYEENDASDPVNLYGLTKTIAEKLVRESGIPWVVVRTSLVYGNILNGTRNNIISWVRENLSGGLRIRVVDDQLRTPTYVEDLAKGILLICKKRSEGIFHISGEETLSPYQMAIKTAQYFGLDEALIERVNAAVFSQPAKRPPRTGFNIAKAKLELGYDPVNFERGLQKMYENQYKPNRGLEIAKSEGKGEG